MEPTTDRNLPTIDAIIADRTVFEDFIYTPWRDAIEELERRQRNLELEAYLGRILPNGIPEPLHGKKSMVLFRHIATSNYEIHRFVAAADALGELSPFILEYGEDKFNDRNDSKYFLGKLSFYKGVNKKGESVWEAVRIVDFNASNNKPLSSIQTTWGEPLVDFHHALFKESFSPYVCGVADISRWLHSFGPQAKDYYKPFLSLFLRDAILFENFFVDEKELHFTKEVIIPAFREIVAETGMKPLIATLAPTEIEGDTFWHFHPLKKKQLITERMNEKRGV